MCPRLLCKVCFLSAFIAVTSYPRPRDEARVFSVNLVGQTGNQGRKMGLDFKKGEFTLDLIFILISVFSSYVSL